MSAKPSGAPIWSYPKFVASLGVGRKVFGGGAVCTKLQPPVASPTGTVYLRCGLADGTPGTGDMDAPGRGTGRPG